MLILRVETNASHDDGELVPGCEKEMLGSLAFLPYFGIVHASKLMILQFLFDFTVRANRSTALL